MDLQEIKEKIIDAICTFIERDKVSLVSAKSHEQSMCTRIIIYLQANFPDYFVEGEWDTHLWNDKTIIIDNEEVSVRPDIIIHGVRHSDEKNLVVFEVKKAGANSKLGQKDIKKIKNIYTSYNYYLWVYVGILLKNVEIRWFMMGQNWEFIESTDIL